MNRRILLQRILFVFLVAASIARAQSEEDPLSHRQRDARRKAVEDFGGTKKTEQAVADGLAWLAAHQQPDGMWNRLSFSQQCPANDRCSQTAVAFESRDANVGLTALATLAFLGAGYTHEQGPYAETLSRAFSYILAQQTATGSFSSNSGYQMYCDAICTIAVAECYALTKDDVLRRPLERSIKHLAQSQQPEGGWDYTDALTHRNDTSITGWCVMAIKSSQAAGVDVPLETRLNLIRHFDRATDPDGRVWYADKRENTRPGQDRTLIKRRYGPAMTATGLFARSALGFRMDDRFATRQIGHLLEDLPNLDKFRDAESDGLHGPYYWYYGSLALFHIGGEPWRQWNRSLRNAVLEYQERPTTAKGTHKHAYGSWPAFGRGWGKWGRTGSRVYSTAINTLTLEVYYRYLPAYLSPRGIIGPHEIRDLIDKADAEERSHLLQLAARFHADIAEPILLDLLQSTIVNIRIDAAIELANIGSPAGRRVLIAADENAAPKLSRRIREALSHIAMIPPETEYGRVTAVRPAAGMLLFDTNDHRVYYGQRVRIMRDDVSIGSAIVNRRFSGQNAAAARIETTSGQIREGDRVIADNP
ncbi:MAG: hypothetical protein H6818_02175 [Phycisphaerales bacterium]|nr:hypothetical protein [Phycisphaerales bacterium]MCB9863120.1 hypothetical protein [Phycisphaerales bacterium]